MIAMGTGMLWEMLNFTYVLSGAQIQAASAVRNLGVTFDTHLKFTEHMTFDLT